MKGTLIGLMWIFTDLVLSCVGHPHYLNQVDTFGNYSGKAMRKLLQLFGLDENVYHREKNPLLPPQYMLDLYKFYSDDSVKHKKSRYNRANTVRSFYDKAESDSGEYFFDLLNSISLDEDIIDAEFHFFTSRNEPTPHNSSCFIQIQVYEGEKADSKLLHARVASAYSSGWEVFKVTSTVIKWVSDPAENLGLMVKVLDTDGREWTTKQVQHLTNYRRPILIVFSKDPKTRSSTQSKEELRTSDPRNEKNQTNNDSETLRRSARSTSLHDRHCMRQELRVDFDRLGWSEWIISPKWYDAYFCAGACAFPLGQNQRPTNHATVQSIVHELGLAKGVRAPCCVPTELKSVSLLYFDEHSNVVLKQYDDMIASGCGCH